MTIQLPNVFQANQAFTFHSDTVELQEGQHTARISLDGENGLSYVEIPYEYHHETGEIILPSAEYRGKNALRVNANNDNEQAALRTIAVSMIQGAKDAGLDTAVRVNTLPLTPEQENIKLVFNVGGFRSVYSPDTELESGDVVVPLTSTHFVVRSWAKDTTFYNVIGSTGDKEIKGESWINLWDNKINHSTRVYAKKCYADAASVAGASPCTPYSNLKGGHIVTANPHQTKSPKGSTVYLLPICGAHNHHRNYNQMKTIEDVEVLELFGYDPDSK